MRYRSPDRAAHVKTQSLIESKIIDVYHKSPRQQIKTGLVRECEPLLALSIYPALEDKRHLEEKIFVIARTLKQYRQRRRN